MTSQSCSSKQGVPLAFPAPVPAPDLPLPAEFDDACKQCGKKMQRMYPCYYGRVKPYATFQCVAGECTLRLLIFDAPRTPYLIWSDTFRGVIAFSDFIEERIAERERKRKARDPHHDA